MKNIYRKTILAGALGLFLGGIFSCSEEEPLNMAPTFQINEVDIVMRTSAVVSGTIDGDVSNIKEYGFDYSESEDFTNNLTTRIKVGESVNSKTYQLEIKGLEANERYYYRMYASTGASTVYSASKDFLTVASQAPSMSELVVDSVGENMIRLKCTIEEIGDEYLIEYGVGYKTAADKSYNPIPSDSIVPESIAGAANTFFVEISGLEPATKYFLRPYAKNSSDANGDTGTREGYGTIVEQQTENQLSAEVITEEIMPGNVGINSVTVSGKILSAVGSNGVVDACGFCWSSTNSTPSVVDNHLEITDVPKLGENFTGIITGLQSNMTYYVRAYAKNTVNGGERIGYGAIYEITTTNLTTPLLEWVTVLDEWGNSSFYKQSTSSSISTRATIKNYDAAALVEKGLIWSQVNGEMSIEEARENNTYMVIETGDNVIDGTIKGLEMNTSYYVRAYAIYHAAGIEEIGYTNDVHSIRTQGFNTPRLEGVEIPEEEITRTSAKLIGKIASTGNGTITERGFCMSLIAYTDHPTLANCDIQLKSDESFISVAKNLEHSTVYAVRGYVISKLENKVDTTYTDWSSQFMTKGVELPTFNHLVFDESKRTYNSITLSTRLATTGDGQLIEKGFIWSTNNWDVRLDNAAGSYVVKGDEYTATIGDLKPSTHYMFRAYAKTNVDGVEYVTYSDEVSGMETLSVERPSLNQVEVPGDEITRNSAKLIGSIASTGNGIITEKGFCVSLGAKTDEPTITNCDIHLKSDETFVSVVKNLNYETRYVVRAYVISKFEEKVDTVYNGWRSDFWTKGLVFPTFNHVMIDEEKRTYNSISVSSKIVTLGDGQLVEKGFVWNQNGSPTMENALGFIKVETDSLAATITGLVPNELYYVNAYAKVNIDDKEYVCYSGDVGVRLNDIERPQTDFDWENMSSTYTSITVAVKIGSLKQGQIIEQGILWNPSTDANPWPETDMEHYEGKIVNKEISNTGFSTTITGLKPNSGYIATPYMKIKVDDYEYIHYFGSTHRSTNQINMNLNVEETTDTSIKLVGYKLDDLGVTEYGFCWSTDDVTASNMQNQVKASGPDEKGEFRATITDLTSGKRYYVGMYIVYENKKYYADGRWDMMTKTVPSINDNTSPDKKD